MRKLRRTLYGVSTALLRHAPRLPATAGSGCAVQQPHRVRLGFSLERAGVIPIGITPIGVHLGSEDLDKLHKLFPRLVNCPNGEALPDKLGSMLSSLA